MVLSRGVARPNFSGFFVVSQGFWESFLVGEETFLDVSGSVVVDLGWCF